MRESTPCCEVEPNPSQPTVDMVTSDSFHARPKKADSRSSLPSRKIAHSKSAAFTPPETTNENCRGAYSKSRAGELPSASHLSTAWDRQQLFKKRSQYFGDVFAYREPHNTAKHRVTRDSIVVVDLKINCELELRQTFLSDISFQLSEIYQRPESCIVVSICTPQAMLFGGSSEPAYCFTIAALASEIAPTKNKRSTALVQGFMQDSLGIAPSRGIVRFQPVPEESLATNGMTALQEIEEMERSSNEDGRARTTMSGNRSRKSTRAYPHAFMERGKTPNPQLSTHERWSSGEVDAAKLSDVGSSEKKGFRRRKSFMALFGR